MEKWKRRALDLVASLILGGKRDMSVVPYYPQKTEVGGREDAYFKRTVPEKCGISSKRIYNMLCELEEEPRANVHSLMVLCHGRVICECSAKGYSTGEWHTSHSMAKSVCGMIIGRLVDRGALSLDMRIVDIFPEMPYKDKKMALITVGNLLTMTSGVDFAEAGAITETEWTRAYFGATVRFAPGTKFAYNSMNSYILARIAERVTGRSFGDLAHEEIFAPLGILSYLWEKGPEGTEKGGWGLYMAAESWAKLGVMILRGGVFERKRILSEKWVAEAAATSVQTPPSKGSFDYGYHLWTGRGSGEILFNGMLGQNVWICPRNDIVAVITSGNDEFFQDSPALEIIRKNLGGELKDSLSYRDIKILLRKQESFFDCRRWVRPLRQSRGLAFLLGIRSRGEFDNRWTRILGSYGVVDNTVSLMPLILRVMQNNLNTSIERITLTRRGDSLILIFREGGKDIEIGVGLYGYRENYIMLGGETYSVRAAGEAYLNACREIEYRIELILPETAHTRMIRIKSKGEGMLDFQFGERPNHRLAENVLKGYTSDGGVIAFAYGILERRIGRVELERIVKNIFSPTLEGINLAINDYEAILKKANASRSAESSATKILRAVITRFFSENDK